MPKFNKYAYSFDGEYYEEGSNTIEGTLEDARQNGEQEETTCFVGKIKPFQPSINTDDIIERLQEQAYSEVGEANESYLDDISEEARQELDKQVNKVFKKWEKKYHEEIFNICDEKLYDLRTDKIIKIK